LSEALVIDASVAVKWYLPEIHADAAARCLDEKYSLLIPDLFLAEFSNVLWKKCRIGEISDTDAQIIFATLEKVPLENFRHKELMLPAYELATGLDRTVYDCTYLALAVLQGCRLLTADRRFFDVVSASPYAGNVHWVEDDL